MMTKTKTKTKKQNFSSFFLTGPAAACGPLQAQRCVGRQKDPLAVLRGQPRGLGHLVELLGPADELR